MHLTHRATVHAGLGVGMMRVAPRKWVWGKRSSVLLLWASDFGLWGGNQRHTAAFSKTTPGRKRRRHHFGWWRDTFRSSPWPKLQKPTQKLSLS